jgi:hypothetical protein
MGPLVTGQHLAKVHSYVDLGVEEGAKLVVDGRGLKLQGYENGFFFGGCLFDESSPRCGSTRRRSLGRCSRSCAAPISTARPSSSTTTNTAMASRSSPATATPRANLPTASRSACRRQRADPGADGVPQLRRLEALPVRRHGGTRHGRRALLYPPQDRHRALARRHPRRRRIRDADDGVGAETPN